MDPSGYDPGLNKQALAVGRSSVIALFGGDADGSPLKVTSNNPGIIDVNEQGALNPNVRVLALVGRKAGTTMVEARSKTGAVWAFVQVQVLAELSPEQRVGEAMRRAIPFLPGEARGAVEAMISPESLMIIAASLLLWAGSHAFGVGECSWYGDVYVVRAQSYVEQRVTLFHELGHSYFSPKFKYMRLFRARLKASAYWRSALLRYLEEALVEGFGQFKVNGLLPALKAVTFPIGPAPYGYVTVGQLVTEGTALGTIVLGGMSMKVVLSKSPPYGMPPTPVQ